MKYCFFTNKVNSIPKYAESSLELINLLTEISDTFDLGEEFDGRIVDAISTHTQLTKEIGDNSYLGWIDLSQEEKVMS